MPPWLLLLTPLAAVISSPLGSHYAALNVTHPDDDGLGGSLVQSASTELMDELGLSSQPGLNATASDDELIPYNSPVGTTSSPVEEEKWWCGNNTFSRGLAHAIAKHDNNMDEINECCRVHDYEYDVARTFKQVEVADTRFDHCLAQETSIYRTYIVRPLYNTAINMNYFYEKFKHAFKSVFLGGDGFIDLK